MQSLLPKTLDPQKDKVSYKAVEELNEVLQNAEKENIRNIALTGPYGAGKSSVLRTLMADCNEGRVYLPISLATLRSDTDIPKDEESTHKELEARKELLNRKIEYSILQQIIYREKATTVPSSRFKRITHLTRKELKQLSFWIIVFIICFFIAFEPGFARIDTFYNTFNFGKLNILFDLIAVGVMFSCLFYALRYIIQGYSNSKLNKLNLKDGEIDLKEETSIFNKHLDEIIYFFRATDYNVVVIEDLDRFETSDIFLKLKELNQLINESKEIKRHVVFVYAVKDDIFEDEARTKFFDYIITIIPVINSSNSKAILKKQLKESGLEDDIISDEDLSEIGFFIQDMRILTNIVQEFNQYRERLATNGQLLDLTKLLAMIVYKNYHPNDFAALHRRAGKVYECISQKERFVEIATHEIKEKIASLEIQKDEIVQKMNLNISELRLVFLYRISPKINERLASIEVDGQFYTIYQIADDATIFDKFTKLIKLTYRYYYHYSSTDINHSNINVNEFFNTWGYSARIKAISQKIPDILSKEIEKHHEEIRVIRTRSLKDLFMKFSATRTSDIYKAINLSELMEVFLIEGYLDENYYDYISYFYPGMLSPADRAYLLNIKRLQDPEYTHHIDKLENFIKELSPNNFATSSILNTEILDYITIHKDDNGKIKEYYQSIISILVKRNVKYDFLSIYYLNGKSVDLFFTDLFKKHLSKIWNGIKLLSSDEASLITECIIRCGDNLNDSIFSWISTHYIFLCEHKNNIGIERVKEIIHSPNVFFKDIDAIDSELMENVIDSANYEIRNENLQQLLIHTSSDSIQEPTISLSAILNCGSLKIVEYLTGTEESLQETLSAIDSQYKNDSLEAIELVLQANIPIAKKEYFLKGQKNRRPNIQDLNDEHIRLILKLNLLEPNWQNVEESYSQLSDNALILSFIKLNAEHLSKIKFSSGSSDETSIFDLLFNDESTLDINDYSSLLQAFSREIDGAEYLSRLNDQQINALLEAGKLPFTQDNVKMLNSSTSLSRYLIFFNSDFITNIDWEYNLSALNAISLLSSDIFSTVDKLKIINKVGAPTIIVNSTLSSIVANIASHRIEECNFTIAEIRSLIKQSRNVESNKVLATYLIVKDELPASEYSELLTSIGDNECSGLAEKSKRLQLPVTQVDKDLLDALQSHRYISSYKEKNGYYRPYYHKNDTTI